LNKSDSVVEQMTISENGEMLKQLIEMHRKSPEDFFELVTTEPREQDQKLIEMARRLRSIVRAGFDEPKNIAEGIGEVRSKADLLVFDNVNVREVVDFLHDLNGTSSRLGEGKDYEGVKVSAAEIAFRLGDRDTWEKDSARIEARMDAKPFVLSLDKLDLKAIAEGMPEYVVYELSRCAKKVVQAPTVVFRGLRKEGPLKDGLAYCGIPRQSFDNQGVANSPLPGMVFVVFVSPDRFVFDWDWVEADKDQPGYPDNWEDRFECRLETVPDTTIVGIDELRTASFRANSCWYSSKGDCIFYYSTDSPSYAQWINDDLTAYYSRSHRDMVVGCKIKNVASIIEEYCESTKNRWNPEEENWPVELIIAKSFMRQIILNGSREAYGKLIEDMAKARPVVKIAVAKAA